MQTQLNLSTAAPARESERIIDLDMLRGFALFGVIVVNIFYFGIPDAFYQFYFGAFKNIVDEIIFHGINFLFTAKFYPIFSFLFGFSFFLQYSRLRQKETSARVFFIRRLTILLLFGLLHVLLVWQEDILSFYALFGFVLVLVADQPARWILWAAVIAYCIFVGVDILRASQIVPARYNPFPSLGQAASFYTTASYGRIMQMRLAIYTSKFTNLGEFLHHFDRLSFFLLGLFAGKQNLLARMQTSKKRWAVLFGLSFLFGIPVQIYWSLFLESAESIWLSCIISNTLLSAQVFSYVTGFLLLVGLGQFKKYLQPLIALGRMALTNYLLHTALFSLLFYAYGLRLYARLSPLQLITLAASLFTIEILFSNVWLGYFRYGPLEWVWRCLTYQKWLPILRPAKKNLPSQ